MQNPLAFPTDIRLNPDDPGGNGGMTLRDYLAGQLISLCWQQACVMVNVGHVGEENGAKVAAGMAYLVADAMLVARARP